MILKCFRKRKHFFYSIPVVTNFNYSTKFRIVQKFSIAESESQKIEKIENVKTFKINLKISQIIFTANFWIYLKALILLSYLDATANKRLHIS